VEDRQLKLAVYNTYYGIVNTSAIDALIRICQRTGVKYFRVALPIAGGAAVAGQAFEKSVIPSYEQKARPKDILRNVKSCLQMLAKKTKLAGVTALVEIHWGTVMSSFTSAYHLLSDIDPDAVAITLDPANMIIEGKEDWEYGVYLLREHLVNVHIKNVSWRWDGESWKWHWETLQLGMVDWPQLFRLLAEADYRGMFAMEDFRVPRDFKNALEHLKNLREETRFMHQLSALHEAA
jgi:sugar phosphate isomerase/epimerase